MTYCIIIFIIIMMYKSMIVVEMCFHTVFPSSISFLYKLIWEINDNLELHLLFVVAHKLQGSILALLLISVR